MNVTARTLAVVALFASAGPLVLFACAGSTGTGSTSYNTTYKDDAAVVFRANLQPCNIDSECRAAAVTPRCANPDNSRCDRTQHLGQSKMGICVFALPDLPETTCTCYEGDVRYCDLAGWGSCTQANPAGCGIQWCTKPDDGGIPPAPAWGTCTQIAPVKTGTGVTTPPIVVPPVQ